MIELMPHQKKAVLEMRNGCILKGGTGSGKTMTALAYYSDAETAERLIVITTAMKRDSGDWQSESRYFGLFPEVDSWNNLQQYEDVEGAFFIFDEQRVVGSGVWVQAFLKITKKNKWVLLSATPGDTWMDYVPVFIAHGFYKNKTEFCREHVVFSRFAKFPKVERWLNTQVLARRLQSILVEMPFERKTTRRQIDIFVEYDLELFDVVWKRRWNYMEERPIKQVSELFSLMRRTVNTSSSRLDRIRDLLIEHPRMIIFYNFDYELEILRSLHASVKVAEWNGHRHESVPSGDHHEWVYLVQYAAGAEGWNCVETDTVLFYSLTYSYRQFEQAKGRIDRLNTEFTDLKYYVLRSSSWIDISIFKCLDEKRNFNETTALKNAHSNLVEMSGIAENEACQDRARNLPKCRVSPKTRQFKFALFVIVFVIVLLDTREDDLGATLA